jgi:hypothetical protein
VRLEPLYVARFHYPEVASVDLGSESHWFFIADGRVEGRISGVLRAANHPRRRADGTFCPDMQGTIATDDGATILFDWRGYGRAYPEGAREIVASATHVADAQRYLWLNDVVCACTGVVAGAPASMQLTLEVAEIVWEPAAAG